MAALTQNKIRIRLKAYDHSAIETAARRSSRPRSARAPPSPARCRCPTEKNVYCVIRSPFKDKDSREHFEIRTHKRLIDILQPTPEDGRLAPAARPPPGGRGHPDPAGLATMAALLGKKLGMTQVFARTDGSSA